MVEVQLAEVGIDLVSKALLIVPPLSQPSGGRFLSHPPPSPQVLRPFGRRPRRPQLSPAGAQQELLSGEVYLS